MFLGQLAQDALLSSLGSSAMSKFFEEAQMASRIATITAYVWCLLVGCQSEAMTLVRQGASE